MESVGTASGRAVGPITQDGRQLGVLKEDSSEVGTINQRITHILKRLDSANSSLRGTRGRLFDDLAELGRDKAPDRSGTLGRVHDLLDELTWQVSQTEELADKFGLL